MFNDWYSWMLKTRACLPTIVCTVDISRSSVIKQYACATVETGILDAGPYRGAVLTLVVRMVIGEVFGFASNQIMGIRFALVCLRRTVIMCCEQRQSDPSGIVAACSLSRRL